jgi:hypothetical protein
MQITLSFGGVNTRISRKIYLTVATGGGALTAKARRPQTSRHVTSDLAPRDEKRVALHVPNATLPIRGVR